VKLDIESVKGLDKGGDELLARLGGVLEELLLDVLLSDSRGGLDDEFLSLGVDISHVHSSLVIEEDLVTIPDGVDTEVVLVGGLVGHKGLDNEALGHPGDGPGLDGLAHLLRDPLADLGPGGVEEEEAGLAAPLDQLVGLGDELLLEQPVIFSNKFIEVGLLGDLKKP